MVLAPDRVPSRATGRWPHVSHSGLDWLTTCERKWAFRYRDGAEAVPTKAMSKGLVFHRLWGAHWRGGDWASELQLAIDDWQDEQPPLGDVEWPPSLPDYFDDMAWLMSRYVEVYGHPWAHPDIEVVDIEREFRVKLPGKYGWLTGRLDGLWLIDGRLWIVEAKTMSDWDSLESYAWSPQVTLYYWVAQQLGLEPWGILLDAARTYRWKNPRPPAESFQRRFMDRNPEHLEAAVAEATAGLVRARDIMRGAYPLRNVDRHCEWCPFRHACREELAFSPLSLEMED